MRERHEGEKETRKEMQLEQLGRVRETGAESLEAGHQKGSGKRGELVC